MTHRATLVTAIFKKRTLEGMVCLSCGLFWIVLFLFIYSQDPTATYEALLVPIAIGIAAILYGASLLLFNRRAFLIVHAGRIKGRYHYFGKIDCSTTDVAFVLMQFNTLTIEQTNGKRHTIMCVQNPQEVCTAIRQEIPFKTTDSREQLLNRLHNLQTAKKHAVLCVCTGLFMMFLNIGATVWLTGARDIPQFSRTDWVVMAVMGAVELTTVATTFWFAHKAGSNNIPIENAKYILRRTAIETTPLDPGFLIQVFADADYTVRVTVFGYPHTNDVYYVVQELDEEYHLIRAYRSDVYTEYLPDWDGLIDITNNLEYRETAE